MQTNVYTLVILYVDGDLLCQMQGVSILSFHTFNISPYEVVGFAGRNPLGKFADMIGSQFPLRLLVTRTADLDLYSIEGVIVRPPHGAENQSIAIRGLQFLRRGSAKDWRRDRQIRNGEKADKQGAEK